MKLGAKIFGALSGLLILYLFLGILLPGRWVAEVDAYLPAAPSSVFPFLNRTDRWIRWNTMPDSNLTMVGPSRGVGAGIRWDDPRYGSGEFEILVSDPPSRVEYQVLIEGGDLAIRGVLELAPEGTGSRLRWTERGDFGWNPLMGYAARGMDETQAEAMRAGLDRLLSLLVHPDQVLVRLGPTHDVEELGHGVRRREVRQLPP